MGFLVAALERTAREWVAEFEAAVVVDADPEQRLENMLRHVRNLFYERPERIRLMLSALIERGPENQEVREGVERIISVMRDAIARGISVLPIPPDRVQGLATLAFETFTGAFFEYLANPQARALRTAPQGDPQDARAVRGVRDQARGT